jgi:hypothetical protein
MSADDRKLRLRQLIKVAAIGVALLGLTGALLLIGVAQAKAWPLIAGDVVLTLVVLVIAWRSLR